MTMRPLSRIPCGASGSPVVFIVCPRCGYQQTSEDNEYGDPFWLDFSTDTCTKCGFHQLDPPPWLDEPDPNGKRPDEWAIEKGHLILGADGGLDPAFLPAGFIKASVTRSWPRANEFPNYKISKQQYDMAMAAVGDPFPVRMRGRTIDNGTISSQ